MRVYFTGQSTDGIRKSSSRYREVAICGGFAVVVKNMTFLFFLPSYKLPGKTVTFDSPLAKKT